MKKLSFFLFVLMFTGIVSGHEQHVHQYITMEAYKLLKMQLGYDIRSMKDRVGDWTSFYFGERAWQRGYITTGAYREDEDDVVYGYSKSNPPTLTGITGSVYDFITIFGGLRPDGFVSSTHFWYADDSDNINTTMRAAVTISWLPPFPLVNATSFTIPNAYQKIIKYKDGNWGVFVDDMWLFIDGDSDAYLSNTIGQTFQTFYYTNLIDLYKTGIVQIRNLAYARYYLHKRDGSTIGIFPTNGTITLRLNEDTKNKVVWEILGRMCHLLQDMSVPAHANIDPHGPDPNLINDYYEKYFGYDFNWNAQNTFSQVGGYINPYQSSNSLHFLMYTTNQMANHFATQGPHYKLNNDDFLGNPLPEEISYLNAPNISSFGAPTTINGPFDEPQARNVRERMFPQAIRATAGLLYWFAKEADLLPIPLTYAYVSGTYDLYQGGTGNWYVQLGNGLEPFTYQWEIMYLDGAGFLQNYESVKKEKEKREKEKKKDGDIIIAALPSNSWVAVGTNSSTFSKPFNPYDLRDYKLRCTVTDGSNTTKVSNEWTVDVIDTPPPQGSIVADSNNNIISLAKYSEEISVPIDYALNQNYPNPFNPTTRISYWLPDANFVTLKIYDMLGSEIATLVNENKPAGKFEVEFDASKLSSGTYVYKLVAGNYQLTKKMQLVK